MTFNDDDEIRKHVVDNDILQLRPCLSSDSSSVAFTGSPTSNTAQRNVAKCISRLTALRSKGSTSKSKGSNSKNKGVKRSRNVVMKENSTGIGCLTILLLYFLTPIA